MVDSNHYYHWKPKRYYNAWNYFDEELQQERKAFATTKKLLHSYRNEEDTPIAAIVPPNLGELFWKIWTQRGYTLPNNSNNNESTSNNNHCYLFELSTPQIGISIVDCPYPEGNITLLAVRNMDTLQEIEAASVANEYGML